MALIKSKLHLVFPRLFIKPFSLPFSTVIESAKNPNVSEGEKATHEINTNKRSNITLQEKRFVKGLNSLIKNHQRENPEFDKYDLADKSYTCTIPSLAESFSQITSGECISPSVAASVIEKCRYTRDGIPVAQSLAFFNWAVNWEKFEIYKQCFVEIVDLLGKARRYGIVWGLIEEMQSRKLDIPSELFVRWARRFVKSGRFSELSNAFDWMEECGCINDPAVITVIIDTFVKRGKAENAQSFFDTFKDWYEFDVVDYTKLIKGWCKAGIIIKAERVFREMKRNGIVPNLSTYNVFIDGLCKHGQFRRAHDVFSEMIEKGCQPNTATFNSLLSVDVKFGTKEKFLQVYNQMKSLGCEPDVITYNFLIEFYCNDVENRDDAVKLIDEMVNKGIVPNVRSFNPIFKCISQVGDVNAAQTLFAKMKELKCKPNIATYNALISVFAESKSADMVDKLIDEMYDHDLEPNVTSYKSVISMYCALGDWETAYENFEEMIEDTNLKPRARVFEACDILLKQLRIAGQTEEHEEILEMLNDALN